MLFSLIIFYLLIIFLVHLVEDIIFLIKLGAGPLISFFYVGLALGTWSVQFIKNHM